MPRPLSSVGLASACFDTDAGGREGAKGVKGREGASERGTGPRSCTCVHECLWSLVLPGHKFICVHMCLDVVGCAHV